MKSSYTVSLFPHVAVGQHDGITALCDEFSDQLCHADRAVPPAGTADGDDQRALPLVYIKRKRERQQILELRDIVLRLLLAEHIVAHTVIETGLLFQLGNIVRIWQEADIKHQIGIERQTVLEAE